MALKIVFRKEDNTRESMSKLYAFQPTEMTSKENYTEDRG